MNGDSNWTPSSDADAIQGTISRIDIEGPDDTLGALFPTQPDGVKFLRENNAWGFVMMEKEPAFVAMYVSRSSKEVRFFARVSEIVEAEEAELAHPVGEYPQFDVGKKVVLFTTGSLYELKEPIPYRDKTPYSLRYITLGNFRTATGTDELF
jgi:hypothetical protein